MLPFHAYYDTLAKLGDTTHPEWQSTAAGLIVLRLVNDWLDFGVASSSQTDPTFAIAKQLIEAIPATKHIKPILQAVIRKIEIANTTSPQTIYAVSRPLAAYARALARQGQFGLTYEALLPVLKNVERAHQTQAIGEISLRLGSAARLTAQSYLAEEHYHTAIHFAQQTGDYRTEWKARLGLGKIPLDQGDFSSAETWSANLLRASKRIPDDSLLSDFLHERSHLAFLAGNHQESLALLKNALQFRSILPRHRIEMIQTDLGSMQIHTGDFLAGKNTSLLLALTAREQAIRWSSLHTLMAAAIAERDRSMFDLYQQALEVVPLHPTAAIDYRNDAAEGFRIFGDPSRAILERRKAQTIAEQHGLERRIQGTNDF